MCRGMLIKQSLEMLKLQMPLDLFPFPLVFFSAVKRQGSSLLANCNKVIVQNYRIFRAIFFEREGN